MTSRKVMLLGEIGVGKTSLVNRFVHGRFRTDYLPTINVEIYTHNLPETDHRPALTLLIWDTDGNFGETIFSHVYLKNADAALIVSDATRPATISTMCGLVSGWKQARPGRPCELLLNKSDLLSKNATERTPVLPSGCQTPMHTSALTGENVEEAFIRIADTIVRRGL